MRFDGLHALITGGVRGIGLATARRMAREGARLILWDINDQALAQAASELGPQALCQRVDVTDRTPSRRRWKKPWCSWAGSTSSSTPRAWSVQMPKAQIDLVLAKIPMQRTGRVDEVAALVCWLASSECSFSTGAVYDASGGRATY